MRDPNWEGARVFIQIRGRATPAGDGSGKIRVAMGEAPMDVAFLVGDSLAVHLLLCKEFIGTHVSKISLKRRRIKMTEGATVGILDGVLWEEDGNENPTMQDQQVEKSSFSRNLLKKCSEFCQLTFQRKTKIPEMVWFNDRALVVSGSYENPINHPQINAARDNVDVI